MEQSMRKTSGGTLWHVTANKVSPRARKDLWLGYCQRTPADMLACDHD
jgi:hypothetical protein